MRSKLMTNVRRLVLSFAAISTLLSVGVSQAATITYIIDQTIGAGSVVGSITTDGNTGVLTPSDFVAWDLKLNGNGGVSYVITNSDAGAVAWGGGSDVTATATNLYFNFSGSDNGFLVFQDGQGSGNHYYCDATSSADCYQGASVVPGYYKDASAILGFSETGNQIIASAPGPVPGVGPSASRS